MLLNANLKLEEAPKEAEFLEYNRDEIFKNLLATEGHLRNLRAEGYSPEYYSCIIKHLADAESHADEAISHSLVISGEEESGKYERLRDMIRSLRKRFQTSPPRVKAAIVETRRIRRFFESFNKPFDISKCISCGTPLSGESKKPLYSSPHTKNPDKKMAWRETGIILGGVHVGKGLTMLADYADSVQPLIPGVRNSQLVNIGGGVALILLPRFWRRITGTADLVMTLVGATMTTKAWDYAVEYLTGVTAAARVPVVVAPPVTPPVAPPVAARVF